MLSIHLPHPIRVVVIPVVPSCVWLTAPILENVDSSVQSIREKNMVFPNCSFCPMAEPQPFLGVFKLGPGGGQCNMFSSTDLIIFYKLPPYWSVYPLQFLTYGYVYCLPSTIFVSLQDGWRIVPCCWYLPSQPVVLASRPINREYLTIWVRLIQVSYLVGCWTPITFHHIQRNRLWPLIKICTVTKKLLANMHWIIRNS